MRFVEPQWIVQRETDTALGTGTRVVLISDLHLGLYKGPDFVGRLAERINALRPDCVLIAGDFLYAPDAPLEVLFGRFKAIQAPVYAVLGNHDDHELAGRRPGGGDSGAVIEGLARAGVSVIESRIVNCGKVAIGGIGDQWSGREDFRAAQAYRGAEPLVLLTHNPDTAFGMPLHLSPLLLSGHTHGGQIRLPLVYRHAMPVKGPFDRGLLNSVDWHAQPAGRPAVFTSSGVGETALPMRLLNPPVIDLLLL
jgi:predicted MPP superfamily phosphohydrolase